MLRSSLARLRPLFFAFRVTRTLHHPVFRKPHNELKSPQYIRFIVMDLISLSTPPWAVLGPVPTLDGMPVAAKVVPRVVATACEDDVVDPSEQDEKGLLPLDILCLVFSHLDVVSLGRCRRVCAQWNVIIAGFEQSIFRQFLLRDFGVVCKGVPALHAYRVQDNLRRGRGKGRLLLDSDAFVEVEGTVSASGSCSSISAVSASKDFGVAATAAKSGIDLYSPLPTCDHDGDEEMPGPGLELLLDAATTGSKRSAGPSGETTRNNSPERDFRSVKRIRRLSALPEGMTKLPEFLPDLGARAAPSARPRRVWHKRKSFMAWPADPADAYLLVLENGFLFSLDPNRPVVISVYDTLNKCSEVDINVRVPAATTPPRVLRSITTLVNPGMLGEHEILPTDAPGPMIGLILGNGKGACVSFDESSQICVWDSHRTPDPEFRLRLVIAAGPVLGEAIFSMNVHDDYVVTAGRFGQVVVFDLVKGDALYSFDLPSPYRYREPQAPGAEDQMVAMNDGPQEMEGIELAVAPPNAPLAVVDVPADDEDAALFALAQTNPNLMNVAMYGDKIAVAVHDGSWWVCQLPRNFTELGAEPPENKHGSLQTVVRRGLARKPHPGTVQDPDLAHEFPAEVPLLTAWEPELDETHLHPDTQDPALGPPAPLRYAPETLAMSTHVLLTNGPDKESIGLWDLSPLADVEEAHAVLQNGSRKPATRCTRLSVDDLLHEYCEPTVADTFASEVRFAEISSLSPANPTIAAALKVRRDFAPGPNDHTYALAVWDFGAPELEKKNWSNRWEKIGLLPVGDHDMDADTRESEICWAWVGFSCEAEDVC